MAASFLTRCGFTRLTARKLLRVQGADASKFLQGILTNDTKALSGPQTAIYAAFLNTKGRVLGDCNVIELDNDAFLVDYDASVAETLEKHMKRYKLRLRVQLEDQTEQFTAFSTMPAIINAEEPNDMVLSSNDFDQVALLNNSITPNDGVIFNDPRGAAFGTRAIVPASKEFKVPDHYQEMPASAYADRRVFLGVAEGAELSDAIPLESNLEFLHGVSFKKGCYVGQELTARTQFKGNIRKRLVPVALVPSTQQDVISALRQVTFQPLDAPIHRELRAHLAQQTAGIAIANGDKIMKEGSSKAAGTIVQVGQDVPAAIAMLRLEHLYPKEEDPQAPCVQFHTADGVVMAVPYQPAWWPNVDAKTGKMTV